MSENAPTYLRTLKTTAAVLMGALVAILVAVTVVLGDQATGTTPVGWTLLVVGLGLVLTVLIPVVGYRFTPIAPGTPAEEARASVVAQLQGTTILRFALAESVGIVGVAVAFLVDEGGFYPLLLGVAMAELLMFWHVWPGDRVLGRAQGELEREGGQSYFREALDSPAPPTR
ncbi:MAG: hypothetical protein J7518_15365 [Nocardioidaceae bacterium]|nr:hypothetical protein [Nocardioidaceae bacterium]